MKKIIICILFIVGCINIHAQSPKDIGKVMLGVKITDDASDETKQVAQQLHSRLSQIATQAGYSSTGSSLFSISPNVIVNYVDVAEGGMKPIYVIQGDLAISIFGGADNTVFSSTTLSFKGSSTDKNKALMSGILKIGYPQLKSMFDTARTKILDYYAAKEEMIFAKADSYAHNQKYDEAIACLLLIPEELFELHSKAMAKAIDIYDKRNQEIARQRAAQLASSNDAVLKKAQSFLSMQNAEEALKALWDYRDGSEKQNTQYNDLIAKAGSLVSEEKQRVLAAERQKYLDARMREDREWSMKVQATEHKMSLDNREMAMKEQAAEHKMSLDNREMAMKEQTTEHRMSMEDKQHDLQIKTTEHNMKIEDKMTDHKMHMDDREMDYNFAALDANTKTEQQKVEAVKTVACEFFKNNPNFITNLK